jgi:Holliday junction resolvase RusA-like endonuclease
VTGKVPAKTRTRFRLNLPSVKPGQYLAWRREIQQELRRQDNQFTFPERWRLKLKARIYLPVARWHAIDVDNCLKSLMDALQGAVRGKGRKWADRQLMVIPNDNQVTRQRSSRRRRADTGRVVDTWSCNESRASTDRQGRGQGQGREAKHT